ncbi:hypothetical protein B0H17DRAFT_1140605 [Mycena rosella]|uniref:Uncharacterized protein n=1 Tax=Mycena rosella TaxID=1033263 RepID=A0AAD7D1I3_MYCRO|nr:hypothetical protein B0H17DRAFT_1140605 [Mycena rosella]
MRETAQIKRLWQANQNQNPARRRQNRRQYQRPSPVNILCDESPGSDARWGYIEFLCAELPARSVEVWLSVATRLAQPGDGRLVTARSIFVEACDARLDWAGGGG